MSLTGFVDQSFEAMDSFERLGEALGGFRGFGRLCHALGGFGFGRLWLWKALGRF